MAGQANSFDRAVSPAGSATDIVARIVGQKLGERLGQLLIIDNRPGASGAVGSEVVAHAAADGYTLGLASSSTHSLAVSVSANLPYDPLKDFTYVSMIGEAPYVLAIFTGLKSAQRRRFDRHGESQAGRTQLRHRRYGQLGQSRWRPVFLHGGRKTRGSALSIVKPGRDRCGRGAYRDAVRHACADPSVYPQWKTSGHRHDGCEAQRIAGGCSHNFRIGIAGL